LPKLRLVGETVTPRATARVEKKGTRPRRAASYAGEAVHVEIPPRVSVRLVQNDLGKMFTVQSR
jgi:hypothetical protein